MMYRKAIDLLEDVYDTLAGNTEFVTPQGFRCNVSEMALDYDTKEIIIDGQYILSVKMVGGKNGGKNGKYGDL